MVTPPASMGFDRIGRSCSVSLELINGTSLLKIFWDYTIDPSKEKRTSGFRRKPRPLFQDGELIVPPEPAAAFEIN
jgi:hypothetical protein